MITLDVQGLDQLIKTLTPAAADAAILEGLMSAGARAGTMAARGTREARAFNTGRLARGWKGAGPSKQGDRTVEVTNPVMYSGVVEFGRLPGAPPPIFAIVAWARRKIGTENVQSAANIARAIGKRGIPATNIILNLIPKFSTMAAHEVLVAVQQRLGRGR